MPGVCFYFQVHQPYRTKKYRVFDVGNDHNYWNSNEGETDNVGVLDKVSSKCYIPTNNLLLSLLDKYPEFKISYSLSGVVIDQFERYAPEVLDSFKKLSDTGRVEILSETYYHSLAFLYSPSEFRKHVQMHKEKIKEVFGQEPRVFRNTELIYNNDIAKEIEEMGYEGILAEGADHVLGWRSPDFIYRPEGANKLKLLLKNYKLSDDIAFRFSSRDWAEWPLPADRYANWISSKNGNGDTINLFMDYETFGEHQWEDTGIFNFLEALPGEIYKHPDNYFLTPREAVHKFEPVASLNVPKLMSWADVDRDLSAWTDNSMQKDALQKIYALEKDVLASGDKKLIEDWRRLQTSDHFYYMCTKWFADGDVHAYFSPYESPYEAFINFVNVLKDLQLRLKLGENISNKSPVLID